jgi:hypothetical protein
MVHTAGRDAFSCAVSTALLVSSLAAAAVPQLLIIDSGKLAPVTMDGDSPRFHIPAGSRLARNEHPRIVLVKEDLAALRQRLRDPLIAKEFAAMKARVAYRHGRGWPTSPLAEALLYKLTGEATHLQNLLKTMRPEKPSFLYGWGAALDLVWDDLDAATQRAFSDGVAAAVRKGGSLYWRPCLHLCAAVYEGGKGPNDAELLARMKQDHQRYLVDWTRKLDGWAAGRGGSDMSHGYNGEHAYWEPFCHVIAWSHATGEDYIGWAQFPKYQSAFYFYHLLPVMKPLAVEKIGVTRTVDDPSAITPTHAGANGLVFLTHSREHDGLGLTWMDLFREQEPAWNRGRDAMGRVLWWNPEQRPLDYTTLPKTRLFPTSGHVVMRSGWTPGATFATFRCGRFGQIDGYWGRNNADNLSFTIRKHGPLAIDSGPVHSQNVSILGFRAGRRGESARAVADYGRQTIAHNSITIGDQEFTHMDWRGNPRSAVVRRGGQSVPQQKEWWQAWGFDGPQREFQEGRITAYRTHPAFDYACGDAFHSYPPGWVEEITRQFIYIKPDVFVVYDRVTVPDGKEQPCWLLHSLREPRSRGAERALSPDEIGPQFLWDGKQANPHPNPGGHFAMGGDSFLVESGSHTEVGKGWLMVRTLFPKVAACERRKIGGQGHEFEVGGVQFGVSEKGYAKAASSYAVRSTVGLLGWRVELRPRGATKQVEFLHILQAGEGDAVSQVVAGAQVTSSEAWHEVSFQHAGRSVRLRLKRTGPRGGDIRFQSPGQVEQIQQLPTVVEDHYRHHRDDPNFRAWVSDPRYRVVIEPTEKDRELLGE